VGPSTRIRSPDRPARSESLYRLSYPGPYRDVYIYTICVVLKYDFNSLKLEEVLVARTVSVGFVVVGMCLGQVFLRLILFSLCIYDFISAEWEFMR
jgi:hypothetical protein